MKERPIIFSAPMVRAILEGAKTQTRRIIKLPHMNPLGQWEQSTVGGGSTKCSNGAPAPERTCIWHTRTGDVLVCPYGAPGDRLWVRETWSGVQLMGGGSLVSYRADGQEPITDDGKWRPSIHLPRWASRITLEVTDVRVERLQQISECDAVCEGMNARDQGYGKRDWCDPIQEFLELWEAINGADSWEQNPWVWVVEFRQVEI